MNLYFPLTLTGWMPFLLSLAITVTVKKIWQAWKVSQPRNGGRESCNFWSQLLKFGPFSFILLSWKRIEWTEWFLTVLLPYDNNTRWPACLYVPSHRPIIYSVYLAVHSNPPLHKKGRILLQNGLFLCCSSVPMGNIYLEILCSV